MIDVTIPEGHGCEHWGRGDSLTADDVHEQMRREWPQIVLLPAGFSADEFYRLDVLRLNDRETQGRTPAEFYAIGNYRNTFYTTDVLAAEATAFIWRKIVRYLSDSGIAGDAALAEAITGQLGDLQTVEAETARSVVLSTPRDWVKRVFRARDHISLSDDD
jgi:hypothetical protein